MDDKCKKTIINFSRFGFAVGCIVLYIIALLIFFSAIIGIYKEIIKGTFTLFNLLDEVGLVVFAIAVTDVSQYLMLEEVIKGGGQKTSQEVRASFSRFVIIIVTALALEGLVLTIEAARSDLTKMLYTSALFFIASLFLVGLGVYQKLNADSEKN